MAPGTGAYIAFPRLSRSTRQAFMADLKQRLTDLTLATFGDRKGRLQNLDALNMLPALQKLSLDGNSLPGYRADGPWDRPYSSMSGRSAAPEPAWQSMRWAAGIHAGCRQGMKRRMLRWARQDAQTQT